MADGRKTEASYSAVYTDGTIAGFAAGKAHQPNAKLVANLSATFSATTGFTGGKIGGGTTGGGAVELSSGGCKPDKVTAEKSEARGTISALSATSITVAGLTCAIPADKTADVNAKFKSGDMAQIRCALVSGTNTLTSISGNRH